MANFTVNNSNILVRGTGAADNFTINTVTNDQIYGLSGNDTFTGRISSGQVYGGSGVDNFNMDLSNNNTLAGNDDNDQLFATGSTGNLISGNDGNDWIGVGSSTTGGPTTLST